MSPKLRSIRYILVITLTATTIADVALVGCSGTCEPISTPCPLAQVQFTSTCGFKSFTSTCSGTSGQSITPTKTEACDVDLILGDGTAHHTHFAFTAAQGAVPCGCRATPGISETIDGFGPHSGGGLIQFGANNSLGPSTCVADAGVASADASSE